MLTPDMDPATFYIKLGAIIFIAALVILAIIL